MGLLRSIFGPSKDEIWSAVAKDIGATFSDGGFWGKDEMRYRAGEWELLLDTYTVSRGDTSTTYTRLRAPFVNKDGLYFKIYRTGIFTGVGKWFGMQDIEIGNPFFDDHFVIKGNSVSEIRRLFSDPEVQRLAELQPDIMVTIKDDEGFFAHHYPDGVDLLQFQCIGTIKDPDRIKNLFDLFAAILERLVHLDSAYEDDPEIRL